MLHLQRTKKFLKAFMIMQCFSFPNLPFNVYTVANFDLCLTGRIPALMQPLIRKSITA